MEEDCLESELDDFSDDEEELLDLNDDEEELLEIEVREVRSSLEDFFLDLFDFDKAEQDFDLRSDISLFVSMSFFNDGSVLQTISIALLIAVAYLFISCLFTSDVLFLLDTEGQVGGIGSNLFENFFRACVLIVSPQPRVP
jgi:hypothetical protein